MEVEVTGADVVGGAALRDGTLRGGIPETSLKNQIYSLKFVCHGSRDQLVLHIPLPDSDLRLESFVPLIVLLSFSGNHL